MFVTRLLRADRTVFVVLLVLSSACSDKGKDGGTAQAATPGGAGGGQRRSTSITLSANDVQRVQRRSLEEGIAVTGSLERASLYPLHVVGGKSGDRKSVV